jgi:hypothetical protein
MECLEALSDDERQFVEKQRDHAENLRRFANY